MRQLWLDTDLRETTVRPSADQRHRLRKVLRLRDSAELVVADGRGGRRRYVLRDDALHALDVVTSTPPMAPRLHVAVGVLKGERQSWLLQKLVEVGADEIAPIALEHCVVKLEERRANKRLERWQAVAVEAFEQCGRSHLPHVLPVQRLSAWLKGLPADRTLAWCDERGGAQAIAAWVQASCASDLAVVIGPEGGLSDAERALLRAHRATPVHLGTAVLRAETAAITAAWAMRNPPSGG